MKKFLILLLVLICIGAGAVVALSMLDKGPEDPTTPSTGGDLDVFSAAAQSTQPTKIVSLTTYELGQDLNGDPLTLSGTFVQVSKGTNSILDYEYDRLALPEEGGADSAPTDKGAIALKNGTYKHIVWDEAAGAYKPADSEAGWQALIPSLQQMGALKIEKQLLPSDYKLSADGKKLTVSLSREEALRVLGVSLDVQGEIALEVQSNGRYVSQIVVNYTMASGATVRISSSYTYGNETLDFSRFN